MRMLAIVFVALSAAVVLAAATLWLKKTFGSASFRAGRERLRGFSVFDLQVSLGGGDAQSKREAALYLTVKTYAADPHSAAKLLFCEKVRHLGE